MLKKISNHYLFYFIYCILVIPSVILIFENIQPKNVAALFAGGLFISCSLLIIIGEYFWERPRWERSLSLWAALIFLGAFSLPMIVMRAVYFSTAFEHLTILFMSAPAFHRNSNFAYIALMICILINYFQKLFSQKP